MTDTPSPSSTSAAAARRAGTFVSVAGLALVLGTSLVGASSPAALPFAAWGAAPYVALWVVARVARSAWPIAGAGLAALVLEVAVRLTVFVVPRGSTAAVALVFSPAVIGAVAMPAGAGLGWIAGRLWRRGPAMRVVVVAASLALGAWTIVGVAWPEQLPTARLARARALAAIGPPRVVSGGELGTWRLVTSVPTWPLVADLDGDGDDDLATVTGGAVDIRRLPSLDIVARHALARPASWSWYSRLATVDGALVVVATGGGFQATRVSGLDDTERWAYHPDATLPPTSLLPADLDGDGATEFYATTATALVRLDSAGGERWRREVPQLMPLGVLAASQSGPGLVAAAEYRGSVHVWRADGTVAATLTWPAVGTPRALAGWIDGPVVVVIDDGCEAPGCGVHATGLDGRERWRLDAPPDMHVVDAAVLWPAPGLPPWRVVVSAAAAAVGRARLQIVDAGDRVRYDEVLTTAPRLLVAHGRAGDTLAVQAGDRLQILASPVPAR